MLIFGFKLSRFAEWRHLLKIEARTASYAALFANMIAVLIKGHFVGRKEWRRRMRICRKCPLFTWDLHRCGPPKHISNLGCRCFLPFKAVMVRQGDGCYGDTELVDFPFGWVKSQLHFSGNNALKPPSSALNPPALRCENKVSSPSHK